MIPFAFDFTCRHHASTHTHTPPTMSMCITRLIRVTVDICMHKTFLVGKTEQLLITYGTYGEGQFLTPFYKA